MNVVDIVALAPYYIQHGVDIIGVKESMELIVVRVFLFLEVLGCVGPGVVLYKEFNRATLV